MAALTSDEKTKIRRAMEKFANANDIPIAWVKDAVNDGAQAVEDALTSMKAAVSADIDTVTSPYGITFIGAQKKILAAWVMEINHVRDII